MCPDTTIPSSSRNLPATETNLSQTFAMLDSFLTKETLFWVPFAIDLLLCLIQFPMFAVQGPEWLAKSMSDRNRQKEGRRQVCPDHSPCRSVRLVPALLRGLLCPDVLRAVFCPSVVLIRPEQKQTFLFTTVTLSTSSFYCVITCFIHSDTVNTCMSRSLCDGCEADIRVVSQSSLLSLKFPLFS